MDSEGPAIGAIRNLNRVEIHPTLSKPTQSLPAEGSLSPAEDLETTKSFHIFIIETRDIMRVIEITQHELQQATRPNIYRNKKKYTRKSKHVRNEKY